MITVEVLKHGTEQVIGELKVPANVYEVGLDQGIEFWVNERDGIKANDGFTQIMLRGLKIMTGVEMESLAQAAIGTKDEPLEAGSISGMYDYISRMLNDFQPKFYGADNCTVLYKGQAYEMPHALIDAAGKHHYKDLSVLEAIELEEYARQTVADRGDNDVTPEQWYRDYLTVLAFLLRMPGEELPMDDLTRETWLTNRKRSFMPSGDHPGISLGVAMEVDFFLTSFDSGLVGRAGLIGSLISARLNQWVVTQKRKVRWRRIKRGVQKRLSTVPG